MATVSLTVPGQPLPQNHHRATILLGAERLTLPVTSEEVTHDGWTPQWTETPRPDIEPLAQKVAPQLEKFSMNVIFQLPGQWEPVDGGLAILKRFANADDPVIVGFTKLTAGFWNITSLRVVSKRMREDNNAIVRAEVALGFTRAKIPARLVTRPATPVTAPIAAPAKTTSAPSKPRTAQPVRYTVRAGDTLSKIAARFLGSASRYGEIARLNKIRDPNRIRVGQVLTIPPR